ncbi:hypothetical protein [Leptospira ilyithenensis]|uniref:Uncharacterized protein n=1 Tax=Leptospira ilyithenensis TaxID=2484901 RepID=A0A4R9LSF5_9LEPT|nr:hypothetical protein [Leptospira ilyithenensis]TGN11933.1 hypothetical protein EHS11_05345 [Leptospira ilyithenensis]
MITTLMMLLGLSGAGAGLYNVIKEPSRGKEREKEGEGSSRRRRERKRAREESGEYDEGDGLPDVPPPKWGGRGKEVPFRTPKGPPDREPKLPEPVENDLPELGDEGDSAGYPSTVPSKSGRSRDKNKKKETKPQALEDIPLGEFGEDDPILAGNLKQRKDKPELSFSADDIISKNSKYAFHRRPLLNAEALVESDHVEEAIEIYTRTGDRIPDPEIKSKIQKNIRDLEEYIEFGGGEPVFEPEKGLPTGKPDESKSKKDSKKEKSGDSKNADYQDFVTALKQVSEVFAESIAKAIQYAQNLPPSGSGQPSQSPSSPPQTPVSDNNPNAIDSDKFTPQKPDKPETRTPDIGGGGYTLPPPGAVGADFLHPLVYQFLKDAPPLPDYSHVGEKETKGNYENLLKSLNQGLMAPPSVGGPIVLPPNFNAAVTPPSTPMEGASPAASGIVGPFYLPNPGQIQSDFQNLSEALSKATEEVGNLGSIAGGMESALGANSKSKDLAGLDLPDDTFFSNEWKQFRDLPLVDRRSGKERRVNEDRREKAGRKDRRSGLDRRQSDKFKEREEYLKDKAVQKLESDVKKAQNLPKSSLNDLLAPYFPTLPPRPYFPPEQPRPEPAEKLGLPDPLAKETPKEEEWIGDESEWFEETTKALRKEVDLPAPVDPYDHSITAPKIGLPDAIDPSKSKSETIIETDDPIQVELMGGPTQKEELKIGLPDPDEVYRDRPFKKGEEAGSYEEGEEPELDTEPPDIEIVDGNLDEIPEATDTPDELAEKVEEEPEKIIHGVLELKPPEADDAPFLTLTYDFGKIPHAFRLSKNYSIMEYSYFKYKPMLMKAQEFARRKMLKNALNYYRVIKSQNIPPELRKMINRNIRDITEFMEKFLMAKGG